MAEARQGYEALAARPYADVLIVGGGINGLATFRDLAMQGVDVALAERVGLRQRRVGGVVAHDPRRHPLSRERRVPPRARGRHRAQRTAADRAALRAAAADDDPDLLDLLGRAQRAAALPAPRRRKAHRARCRAHQDRPRHLRLVLAQAAAASPRHAFHGRRRSLEQLPHLNPDREVHRHVLGRVAARPRAPRDRRAPRRARRGRRPRARGELHRRGRCR